MWRGLWRLRVGNRSMGWRCFARRCEGDHGGERHLSGVPWPWGLRSQAPGVRLGIGLRCYIVPEEKLTYAMLVSVGGLMHVGR